MLTLLGLVILYLIVKGIAAKTKRKSDQNRRQSMFKRHKFRK